MKTSIAGLSFLYTSSHDERFARMRELGYTAVDESLEETEHPYYRSYEAMEEHCKSVRAAADRHGIEVFQIHASYGVWYDKGNREDNINDIVRIMEMGLLGSSILGAKNYVIHPIHRIGFWNNGYDLDVDEKTSYTTEVMKRLIPTAKKFGINICLENLCDYQIPRVLEIINAVDSPYAGICLDTGHASVSRVDMGEIVRQCGNKLYCLHVHDTNGYSDLHLPAFMGVIDWAHFTDALGEIGYCGTMNLESEINRGCDMPDQFRIALEEYSANTAEYLAEEVEKKRAQLK